MWQRAHAKREGKMIQTGLKTGPHLWSGMGVNNSEKFILEFSNHKRPQTTTLDQGQPHQKE